MQPDKLMYLEDVDFQISKRHLMHVYKAEVQALVDNICNELQIIDGNLTDSSDERLVEWSDLKASYESPYRQIQSKLNESLDHLIEHDDVDDSLIDKFSPYWKTAAKKFYSFYSEIASSKILKKSETEDLMSAIALTVSKTLFLAEQVTEFIKESSNARQDKLQNAFTAATFSQMNGYIRTSPRNSLKDFNNSYVKPQVDKWFDKYIDVMNSMKAEEEGYIDGQLELANTEEVGIMTDEIRRTSEEEIIETWDDCVDHEFVQNEASEQLKQKFPKIANQTANQKISKFLDGYVNEKLSEANYVL